MSPISPFESMMRDIAGIRRMQRSGFGDRVQRMTKCKPLFLASSPLGPKSNEKPEGEAGHIL